MATLAQWKKTALGFEGAFESTSYGTPCVKTPHGLLTRQKEDPSLVMVRVDFDQRAMLIDRLPEKFFITDHYRDYPAMLVRLAQVSVAELKQVLTDGYALIEGEAAAKRTRKAQAAAAKRKTKKRGA